MTWPDHGARPSDRTRRRGLAGAAVLVALLPACSLVPTAGQGSGGSDPAPSPSVSPQERPYGQVTDAAEAAERIALVTPRTGGTEVVGVEVGPEVRVQARSHDRTYSFGEDDFAPRATGASLWGEPFDATALDLAPLMAATGDCDEPAWTVRAYAYDMRLATHRCSPGPETLWTVDGEPIDISTDTPEQVAALAAHLPQQGPDRAYWIALHKNSAIGDHLRVEYADPDRGSVQVTISDDGNPVRADRLSNDTWTFPLESVDLAEVARCGDERAGGGASASWGADIHANREGDILVAWDGDATTSSGTRTDLDCNPVE